MKRYVILFAFFAILVSSCKKEEKLSGLEGVWAHKSYSVAITYKGEPYESSNVTVMHPISAWEYRTLAFGSYNEMIIGSNCPLCLYVPYLTNYSYENNILKVLYNGKWYQYNAVRNDNILTITIDKDQYLKMIYKGEDGIDYAEILKSDDYKINYTVIFTTDKPE